MKTSAARRERGAALFVAILLLLILTVTGIALMFTASVEQTLSSTDTKISKIFYAADSGFEYASARLATRPDYSGGAIPVGISSHYPDLPSADMEVSITTPILLGSSILTGDAFESISRSYESSQIVENIYTFTSSAQSTWMQASKTIEAEISIYMRQQRIPE
ncbi:MAG: PilX N-terminal domain-containing pilus assembly protein [Thermoplasmata archaeon]